uniref:NADH:flavin oxidoreductase/NADH oxidase N-terminal domain-containing protein n=1 Tax=Phytophthora ramorum TaxID=164328 RepID=H3G5L1_PHYRM
LLEQFLHDGINDRTDRYGGSVENRARIVFEALDAMLEVIDSSRLGIRFSPHSLSFRQRDSNPVTTYQHVLQKLSSYGLAYVHLIELRGFFLHESPHAPKGSMVHLFRPLYDGTLITASDYDRSSAIKTLEDREADLVAFWPLLHLEPGPRETLEAGCVTQLVQAQHLLPPGRCGV